MDFKNTFGRLIGVVNHKLLLTLEREFKEYGVPLTSDQFKMMSHLWQSDGISQQELSDRVGRNRSAGSRMIDTLQKKGILTRKDHPIDQRQKLIFVTPKGKQIKKKAIKAAESVLEEAMSGFTRDERDEMKKNLRKIITNLS